MPTPRPATPAPMSPLDLMELTIPGLEALLEGWGEPGYRGRQIARWIYGRRATRFAEMTDLPKALRGRLEAEATIGRPAVAGRQVSRDGTRKFLLRLADGQDIESVLIEDEGRLTACISSQVGCPLDCKFCLTGVMGLRRNMSAGEIGGQILVLQDALIPGERIGSIVLMGMGEPLLNFPAVAQALTILTAEDGAGFPPRRLTLSTAGHVPGIRRLAEANLGVNLAVSLAAATDAVRDRIMPINRRWSIAELLGACRAFPVPPRRHLTFEYVLLGGVNDSLEEARTLTRILRGIRCKVNLIPFNPAPDLPFHASPRPRMEAFQAVLRDAGYMAFIRETKGWDISAACGMLRTAADALALSPP